MHIVVINVTLAVIIGANITCPVSIMLSPFLFGGSPTRYRPLVSHYALSTIRTRYLIVVGLTRIGPEDRHTRSLTSIAEVSRSPKTRKKKSFRLTLHFNLEPVSHGKISYA